MDAKIPPERILVVDEESFDAHEAPRPHPERPERLTAARDGLSLVLGDLGPLRLEAPLARCEDLEGAHSARYLTRLQDALRSGSGYLDPDTFFSAGSREAALRASGGAVEAIARLREGQADRAFLLLRPPGHHATGDRAMGFCLVNHIAVAASSALAAGCERVAIVDWDVHHGNGTQAIFESDPRVLFVSLHQAGIFPGTGRPTEIGEGAGRGKTINVGLPGGTDGAGYAHAFREVVLPTVRAHGPELVLVSAGFDGHSRDPLAGHELDAYTYGAMASAVLALGAPTALFLEGGYDLIALAQSVEAVGRALCGEATELPEDRPRPAERAAVEETLRAVGLLV
jgi:acetoin utilization deacetylase AcuC-like enzyme